MSRIGLILILACAITGGMFHFWSWREKPLTPAVMADAPPAPAVEKKKAKAQQRDVDFNPYMAELQRRIKRQWFPPQANVSDKVAVVFKIHSNGMMSNLRLLKPSSSALGSQAALKAVQNATPFRRLPKGAPDDVDIQFSFDYNVFEGGKLK